MSKKSWAILYNKFYMNWSKTSWTDRQTATKYINNIFFACYPTLEFEVRQRSLVFFNIVSILFKLDKTHWTHCVRGVHHARLTFFLNAWINVFQGICTFLHGCRSFLLIYTFWVTLDVPFDKLRPCTTPNFTRKKTFKERRAVGLKCSHNSCPICIPNASYY